MISCMYLLPFSFYLLLLQNCFFTTVQSAEFYEERTIAFFNESSYIVFNKNISLFNSSIELSFRTCQENGTLLRQVMENNNSFTLNLKRGTLFGDFYFFSNKTTFSIAVPAPLLNENEWVNITMEFKESTFNNTYLHLTVDDGNANLTHYIFNSTELLNFYSDRIMIANIGSFPDISSSFVGCIKDDSKAVFNQSNIDSHNILWDVCPLDNITCTKNVELSCVTSSATCLNGTCVEVKNFNRTVCECDWGYYGTKCNKPGFNPCYNSSCLNNATCESLDSANYTCWCLPGFFGERCENETNECMSEPCSNNGECRDLVNGFECFCNGTGFEGMFCDLDVDECLSRPCANNSTCVNGPGNFTCNCSLGFEGRFCDVPTNKCLLEPCQNSATCVDDEKGAYSCLCSLGFTGDQCEKEIDYCVGNQCNPHSEDCVSEPGRHYCVCKRGFGGANCTELNECISDPCVNEAICIDEIDRFSCSCLPGYTGILCEVDINECENSPCSNDAPCTDLVNDYYCLCGLGWTGKNCSEEFQPCQSNPCENNATCSTLLHTIYPGYNCTCRPGFTGYDCEVNVDDCAGVACSHNERCIDGIETYTCNCNLGYTRDGDGNCTIDINECESSPCQNGAECIDEIGRYKCNCSFGYEGEMCEREINFCDLNLCQNMAICQPSFGTYTCFCKSGFVGKHCEFFYDSCASNPCIYGECVVVEEGAYWCNCTLGYDGVNCGNEVDECQSNPCLNGGNCNDLIGQFNCTCAEGWSGTTCEINIDECLSQPCLNGGNCSDEVAGYTCTCPDGYGGTHCGIDINECESSPCLHGGSCIDGIASFQCVCRGTGYEGSNCEVEIDECKPRPCQHGAECVDLINDYECRCLDGYSGTHCEKIKDKQNSDKTDEDECASMPCQNNGDCLEKSDKSLYMSYFPVNFTYENAHGFVCNCSAGYEGKLCEVEIDECERWSPCFNNATCLDLIGDYKCECIGLYGGRNCSVELLGCEGHSCSNNGTCFPYLQDEELGLHNYTCDCASGFTGVRCGQVTSFSLDGTSQAVFEPAFFILSRSLFFAFRTTVPDGLLAIFNFANRSDVLQIYLDDGKVHTEYEGGVAVLPVSSSMNDGAWHYVHISFHQRNVTLWLNSPSSFTTFAASSNNTEDVVLTSVVMGLDNRTDVTPYVGCIRDLTIDEHVYVIDDVNYMVNVTEGCTRHKMCTMSSCAGRGTCIDLWTTFRCDCARPFVGDNCNEEITPATFNYKNSPSYALFQLPHPSHTKFNASLYFLTTSDNGMLMTIRPVNQSIPGSSFSHFHMQLIDGSIRVAIGNVSYLQGSRLDNGRYHFVDVAVEEDRLNVALDGISYSETSLPLPFNVTSQEIFIGGIPPLYRSRRRKRRQVGDIATGFKGVLQDVQANGIRLIFFEKDIYEMPDSNWLLPSSMTNVREGVISDPVCGTNHSENPCKNNGICDATFNAYTCNCAEEWKGRHCDVPIFCKQIQCPESFTCHDLSNGGFDCVGPSTFSNSTQRLAYSWHQSNISWRNISFSIRTRSVDGDILAIQSETSFIRFNLDLTGRIKLTYLSPEFNATLQSVVMSDGEWHSVVMTTDSNTVNITVDNVVATSNGSFPIPDLLYTSSPSLNQTIILGSFTSDSFKGCISDVRIDDQLLAFYNQSDISAHPLASNSLFILASFSSPPVLGCHGDDVCSVFANPCENNASCVDLFNSFKCDCQAGFSGRNCSIDIDECVAVNCSGRGNCSDGINQYSCLCEIGYQGEICEIETNECASSPCSNNGTCRDMIGYFECDCDENFAGETCEINVTNSCGNSSDQNAPCLNGGTCHNITTNRQVTFSCQCVLPYFGDTCKNMTDACATTTCHNNGTCLYNKESLAPYCECAPGFEGPTCGVAVERCSGDTCMNNASCEDRSNGFFCNCLNGYIGLRCNLVNRCANNATERFCFNDGVCHVKTDENSEVAFACNCAPEFAGPRCNYKNPCFNNTCQNGGTCHTEWHPLAVENMAGEEEAVEMIVPMSKCVCPSGYQGSLCEIKSGSQQGMVILASTVGGVIVLLLLLACLSYFVGVIMERRSSSGAYSPRKQEAAAAPMDGGFVGMDVFTELKPPPKCERLI